MLFWRLTLNGAQLSRSVGTFKAWGILTSSLDGSATNKLPNPMAAHAWAVSLCAGLRAFAHAPLLSAYRGSGTGEMATAMPAGDCPVESAVAKAKLATRLPIGTYGSRGRAKVASLLLAESVRLSPTGVSY